VPRQLRPWLVALPLATLGLLAGHLAAYRLTGHEPGELHSYLGHLPQVLLVLVVLGLLGTSLVERDARIALWPYPAVAVAGFVVQEHLERFAHDGVPPFLVDEPVFLVGLALQAPVALLVWASARLLLRAIGRGRPARPPAAAPLALVLPLPPAPALAAAVPDADRPRGPPGPG
jgi:hypothetical protein